MTMTPYSHFIANLKEALTEKFKEKYIYFRTINNQYFLEQSIGYKTFEQHAEHNFNQYLIDLENKLVEKKEGSLLIVGFANRKPIFDQIPVLSFNERAMLLYRDSNNLNKEQFMECFNLLFPVETLDPEIGFHEFVTVARHNISIYNTINDYTIEKVKERVLNIVEHWDIHYTDFEVLNENLMVLNLYDFKNQSSQASKALKHVLSLAPDNFLDSKSVDTWVERFCEKNLDNKDIYPFLSYLPDDYLKYENNNKHSILDLEQHAISKFDINIANFSGQFPLIKKIAQLNDALDFLPILKQSSVLNIDDIHFIRKDNLYSIFVQSQNFIPVEQKLFTYYFESCLDHIINQCEGLGEAQRNESLTKYLTYLDFDYKLPDKDISTTKKKKKKI